MSDTTTLTWVRTGRGALGGLVSRSSGEVLTTRNDTGAGRTLALVRSLNLAQRVVLVVALGAVLYLLGSYLTGGAHLATGWTGYAPLQSAAVVSRAGLNGAASLVLWLFLVGIWAAASLAILRNRRTGVPSAAPVDAEIEVRETGNR